MVAEVEVRELAAAQRAVMGYLATYPHGYLQMGYSRKIRRGSPGWLRSGALAGARVVVSGRNRERSDQVVAMITGAGGLAYVVPADLADKIIRCMDPKSGLRPRTAMKRRFPDHDWSFVSRRMAGLYTATDPLRPDQPRSEAGSAA